MMLNFSQRDPLWAQNLIGHSKLTIGRYGCTLSSIAMLSTYFGDNLAPDKVAKMDIFTPYGLVVWARCQFGHFRFSQRVYTRNDAQIKAALADPDQAVILQVAFGSHWVVATGWSPSKNLFTIADPWFGDRCYMDRYLNSITGMAFFRRNP